MKVLKSDIGKIPAKSYKTLLLDGADFSDYLKEEPTTDKEKVKELAAIFKSEYGFQVERSGSQKAAQEYVRGLPSALHYPFSDWDIIQWMQKELSATIPEEYHCDAVDKYWQKLGACFSLLVSKYL